MSRSGRTGKGPFVDILELKHPAVGNLAGENLGWGSLVVGNLAGANLVEGSLAGENLVVENLAVGSLAGWGNLAE